MQHIIYLQSKEWLQALKQGTTYRKKKVVTIKIIILIIIKIIEKCMLVFFGLVEKRGWNFNFIGL